MLKFKNIEIEDKAVFDRHFHEYQPTTIEYMFSTLFLWRKSFRFHWAEEGDVLLITTWFKDGLAAFPPVAVKDADFKRGMDLLQDYFKEQSMPFRLTEITKREKNRLEKLYPARFCFMENRNAADYVYNTTDLANLAGRSYNGKRNHIRRFKREYPNYQFVGLNRENLATCRNALDKWYANHELSESLCAEKQAMGEAFAISGYSVIKEP